MANLIEHRKAHFDYDVLEQFEAGIELHGFEVKSLRARRGKLEGAHVVVRGKEAYLVGMDLPPYQPGNTPDTYDTSRSRRLLLTKKELEMLEASENQKGLTIVPLSLYSKGTRIKVSIAVARGRKKYDKRAVLKRRETEREIERTLKNR